ncbi:MAG: ATP synthase F0 subunit B [Rhizobiales bacterium]|nr:ATP synthase F0 subunit B [Hyphomicrobiales bacterium]MBA67691.1 ATP synthase F0 subunit B [Hyphomicrobiales bacterium]|tara:strand:+ start:67 stop:558 length:492 start_codon:yes stop_codon:yes gene_type:complete
MDATSLASLWAFVGLVIFLGILAYMKVPAMMAKNLDKRAADIATELEQAKKLREEAQQLLAEYQRKRNEAEEEAKSIVAAAEKEAAALREEARQKTEDYVARRTSLAEQKIRQAETEAVNEVRASAVELAIAAAEKVMAEKVDAKKADDLFKSSLTELKGQLN